MLVGLGAWTILGCGGDGGGGAVSAAPAPSPVPAPTLTAPPASPVAGATTIVAPGVTRAPRSALLAGCGAGLAQLRGGALWIRDWDGRRLQEHPLERGQCLCALPDGTLVAIGRREDRSVALFVSPAGEVEVYKVLVIPGEIPAVLLPMPGDASIFWLLDSDRSSARRTSRVERWGELGSDPPLVLDNANREDVVALASGLIFHHLDAFEAQGADGQRRRVPWTPSDRIARLAPGLQAETLWALAYDGQLTLFDLKKGAARRTVAVGATAIELAADEHGVATLSATRPAPGPASWSLHALDPEGQPTWNASEEGLQPAALALSANRVAAGDGERLRIWSRKDGAVIYTEG